MYQVIEILNYDDRWPKEFNAIKQVILYNLEDLVLGIEHIGSTSVKGLAAKPILDIDIVIENNNVLLNVILGLEKIGYSHQEEWSIEGREAFVRKDVLTPWDGKHTKWMEHHLYVCNKDSEELARHMAFRDYLRNDPVSLIEYENIKRNLAKTVKERNSYSLGKNEFIKKILSKAHEL